MADLAAFCRADPAMGTRWLKPTPSAASGLSFLTGLGDKSLGEAYLGLTRVSGDEGT